MFVVLLLLSYCVLLACLGARGGRGGRYNGLVRWRCILHLPYMFSGKIKYRDFCISYERTKAFYI